MANISSSLLKKFVDVTSEEETRTGYYAYGTAIVDGDSKYVQLDGSDALTSVSIATDLASGDRVLIYVENHTASVIGNVTCPASGRTAIEVDERLLDAETWIVGELQAISAEFEEVYANYASIEYLNTYFVSTEYLLSNYIMADIIESTYATVDSLDVLREYVKNLEASEITVEYLDANYANINDLNVVKEQVQNLDAVYATIEWVKAGYATIEELEAYYAYIYELDVDVANIKSLLAGTAGVGELETIYLTSDNVVIQDALINNAMIVDVSADKLTAGTIYTSLIRIQTAEEDESLYIDNSLIQMSEDDLVRLQAGKDATGEYNFYIWNSEGKMMFDATGATADGIGKEVIVNTHVADDANIAGYKLDIDSVASYLNENGGLVVNAEHVTIGGGTLDYLLGEMQEDIYDLKGVTSEGMSHFTPYYAYSLSPDEPPMDEDEIVPALTDVAITDYSFTDVYENDSIWTKNNPGYQKGLYLWVRYYCEYNDGHFEWSTPVLLTDSYLRSITSDLMTEFEIINGEITAKIWQSDIEESITTSITDLWTIIDLQLGSIILEVEYLSTDVFNLSEEFVTISANIDGISESVYSLETNLNQSITDLENKISQIDGVVDFKTYFCLWNSAVNEPITDDEVVPALTDVAVTDYSFTDVYENDGIWTEEPLQPGSGQYLWICFWLEYQDGHTEWKGPYCLTDNYIREQWAKLDIELNSISLEVVGVKDDLETNYATKASLVLQVDSYTGVATLSAQADYIDLIGDQISITSTDGNFILTRYGHLETYEGIVGGWNITERALWGQFVSVETELVEQQARDEEGNLLYEEEPVLDSNGNQVYTTETRYVYDDNGKILTDSDGNPITETIEIPVIEKIPVMELVEIEVPGSYYDNYTTLNIDAGNGDMAIAIGSTSMNGNIPDLSTGKLKLYNSGDMDVININSTGKLSMTYEGGLIADFISSNTNNARIRVTSPTEKKVWMGVGSGGENRGIYDEFFDSWIIYNDGSNTVIPHSSYFNSAVTMKNTLKVTGSITSESNLIVSTSSNSVRNIRVSNSNGSVDLSIKANGQRGLFDTDVSDWIIGVNEKYECYCGIDAYNTTIRGNIIYMNNPVHFRSYFIMLNLGIVVPNNYGVYHGLSGKDITGGNTNWVRLEYLDTSDQFNLGHYQYVTILRGSSVYLNGTTTAVTSDRQFKDNIEPFEPDRTDNFTDKLTPKIYTMVSDPETKHIGFIVDEVENAMRAAGYDPDEYGLTDYFLDEDGNKIGAIRYDEFIPILLYEIQELRDRVNALENPEEGLIDPGIELN